MLPSLGFSEMLLLVVLAIIFVGPKDLPKMMRTLGQYIGKLKAMSQEFKDAFDEMGRETELAELRKEIDDLKSMGNLSNLVDEDFDTEMRALDTELRDGAALEHPRTAKKSEAGGDDG